MRPLKINIQEILFELKELKIFVYSIPIKILFKSNQMLIYKRN